MQRRKILCWGPQHHPYWRHLTKSQKEKCEDSGESELHKLAKELLCDYLKTARGALRVQTKCANCVCKFKRKISPNNLNITIEHQVANIRFDIAGTNNDGVLVFGIEICNKHVTNSLMGRSRYKWVEVSATRVVELLDVDPMPENIQIDCLRDDIWNLCKKCKNIPEDEIKRKHLSKDQILEELGYLVVVASYVKESMKMLDCAVRGKYKLAEQQQWMLPYKPKRDDELWNMLLEMVNGHCVKCNRKHEIVKYKPYCSACYSKIRKEDGPLIVTLNDWIPVTDEEKKRLRQIFRFLTKVPSGWTTESKCYFCDRDYIDRESNDEFKAYWKPLSNYVQGYCFWPFTVNENERDKKKRCCVVCLEKKYQEMIVS